MKLNDDVLLQLDTLEPSQETAAISTEQFEKKDDFSLFPDFVLESDQELLGDTPEIPEVYSQEILQVSVSDSVNSDILEHTIPEIIQADNFLSEIQGNTQKIAKKFNIFRAIGFFMKFSMSSLLIFGILMLASNYQAYYHLAASYLNADDLVIKQNSLIHSVEASMLETSSGSQSIQTETFQGLSESQNVSIPKESIHSISQMMAHTKENGINLNIEITPYENRIVIPKIGKNIPLIDVKEKNVESSKELENIFMKELEGGVVRYPSSALPGENGNAFVFGHSSNFPWMAGEYNDVFALLDKLDDGDEIIVYYNQQKFVYRVNKKDVILPGDVSVLQKDKTDHSELNLMTCWPIGTTFKRLIVSAELVK